MRTMVIPKIFSATKARDRESLGERVTAWLRRAVPLIVRKEVHQSSDNEFHCLTIVIWHEAER